MLSISRTSQICKNKAAAPPKTKLPIYSSFLAQKKQAAAGSLLLMIPLYFYPRVLA
jgi:hypothetical protein